MAEDDADEEDADEEDADEEDADEDGASAVDADGRANGRANGRADGRAEGRCMLLPCTTDSGALRAGDDGLGAATAVPAAAAAVTLDPLEVDDDEALVGGAPTRRGGRKPERFRIFFEGRGGGEAGTTLI